MAPSFSSSVPAGATYTPPASTGGSSGVPAGATYTPPPTPADTHADTFNPSSLFADVNNPTATKATPGLDVNTLQQSPAGKMLSGIAPILGDVGHNKTGKQLFGDTVASALNIGTFFLDPFAAPEEIAGEQALKAGAEEGTKVAAQTGLQKLGGMAGRAATFGGLAAGSTAAQDIGNGDTAGKVAGDSLKNFFLGGALSAGTELLAPKIVGGIASGLNKIGEYVTTKFPALADWLTSSGSQGGKAALDQLEQAKMLQNQKNAIAEMANSNPNLDQNIRESTSNAARASAVPVHEASKNAIDQLTSVLGTGGHFSQTGDVLINKNIQSENTFREMEKSLYNQVIPKNADATAELTHTNEALDKSISELSKPAKGNQSPLLRKLSNIQREFSPQFEASNLPGFITADTPQSVIDSIKAKGGVQTDPPTLGELNANLQNLKSDRGIQDVLAGRRAATPDETHVINVINAMQKDIGGFTDPVTKEFFPGTLGKEDPAAINIKQKADQNYYENKNVTEKNPLVAIIRDPKFNTNPGGMLQKLVDASLSKDTHLALGDIHNFYSVLGGATSPESIAFKESIVSSMLKNAAGDSLTTMYTPEAVKELGNQIANVEKSGLLDAKTIGMLKDFHTISKDIVANDAFEARYLDMLRHPEKAAALPGAKDIVETAANLKAANDIQSISGKMNANPDKIVSDLVGGKYDEKSFDTIYKNLSPENQDVLKAKINEKVFGQVGDRLDEINAHPTTAITEKTIPDIVKNFEDFKKENPTLTSKLFDDETVGAVKSIASELKAGETNKAVNQARTMAKFRTGMAIMEIMRGSPMGAAYMGSRALMDFERVGYLEGAKAPQTLSEIIAAGEKNAEAAKPNVVKEAAGEVSTPIIKGTINAAITKPKQQTKYYVKKSSPKK